MKTHTDILAIHPGALGDCILLGRVLGELGCEGEVAFVGHASINRLLAGLGVVQKTLDFDLLPMHELFTDALIEAGPLARQLGACDRLISMYGEGNPAAEQRLIRACGAKTATFLPIRPPAGYAGHLTEHWLAKLASPLRRSDLCARAWPVPTAWREAGLCRLREAGVVDKKYIVLHPGAGGVQKRWPMEKFVEVAQAIQTQLDKLPVFVLGPVECEIFTKSELHVLQTFPAMHCPSLEEFAGLLAGAEAMVGNDSGPAHLAASVGIKTVCIFCTMPAVHFSPLGPAVTVLRASSVPELVADDIIRAILIGNVR